MPEPIRLFIRSLWQFAIGLAPAILMAVVCLAIQVGLAMAVISGWEAIFPSQPFDFGFEPGDWRDQAGDLIASTLVVSVLFFFHALVALILTAWLLRRPSGFAAVRVLRRAVRGAGVLTFAAMVLFVIASVLSDMLPATRFLRFDFYAAAMLSLWFGGTALVLPARLMGHEPAAASGWGRTTLMAAIALLPWFFASEVVGAPLRNCRECWGLFEGGLFTIPLLGAYLLGLTVSSAAVSAAACMPRPPSPSVAL